MTVDDCLRAAAEDTRQSIEGLARPKFRSKRFRPSTLRWVTAITAVLVLTVTIWPQVGIEPPFEVKPGEKLLSVDPPVVGGASGPVPQFDTSSLGTERQLREIDDIRATADQMETQTRGRLLKVTVVGMTELGSMAAFIDSSNLPCIWIDARSGKSCSVVTSSSDMPITITRGLSGTIAWGPLPSEVSAVVLEYGGMKLWQRPVAGIGLFDTDMSEGEDYVLTAIDPSGEPILTETATFVP